MRMGGGWKWVRILSNSAMWLFGCLGCATREVVSKMELRGIGCEDRRWVEVGQDIVE